MRRHAALPARTPLVACACAAAVAVGASGCVGASSPAPAGAPGSGVTPPTMERFTVSEYAGSVLRRRLRAQQATVVPRRAGGLAFGPLRELVLGGVELELFLDEDASARSPGTPFPPAEALERGAFAIARGGRQVAGASFRGFEGSILRGGEVLLRVVAERGTLDLHAGGLELAEVTIEHRRAGRTFRAHRALWREETMEIPGVYQVGEGDRVTTARGLRIELADRRAPP